MHLKLLTSSVQARRDGRAFVDFVLTEGASQSWPWPALALAIEARIAGTFVHLDSAVGARSAGLAEAQS